MNHRAVGRRYAEVCTGANPTYALRHRQRGTAVALHVGHAEVSMLMFKRTQLYIGFALAALAEIIVRAVAR